MHSSWRYYLHRVSGMPDMNELQCLAPELKGSFLMLEKNFDNRFRRGQCHFELAETGSETIVASGVRFETATFDPMIGSEIVIRLTDSTPFANELKREPFTLRLKSGIAQTSEGPVLFLLWWIPPITDGKPFALYE